MLTVRELSVAYHTAGGRVRAVAGIDFDVAEPHLDVFENVAYPLRVSRARVPAPEIEERVMATLAVVGLGGLARRPSTALSGGQQQRVALARAIVRRPRHRVAR